MADHSIELRRDYKIGFRTVEFFYTKTMAPLEWNPYKKIDPPGLTTIELLEYREVRRQYLEELVSGLGIEVDVYVTIDSRDLAEAVL